MQPVHWQLPVNLSEQQAVYPKAEIDKITAEYALLCNNPTVTL